MNEKFDLFIIDDDPTITEEIVCSLDDYQLTIKTFIDPIKAIAEMIKNPPRVVFLDYNMPAMNGKNFIIKMSEHYLFQHSSVYLITGMNFDQATVMQLQTLGFSRVIQKPFTGKDLLKALEESIGVIQKKQSVA
jgi:two-component system chemotaxis response regulator CheY